ncbi:MAG: cation:proton antiporter subunit C [Parvularcula sp.]|jgi:multicomponent Na+:H+ antiporter subunit C|nr:cation:proton antiporter subunit C [Parvularcula sp.]
MLEFVLARYNYWIVIILMMTGLYIVFSRGNLVKTLVGLNLFQTSVFIFYITVGKVAGGTAPILIGGHDKEEGHHDELSHPDAAGSHGGDHSAGVQGTPAMANEALGESHDAMAPGGQHLEGRLSGHGADAAASLPGDMTLDVLYSNPLPHVLILTAIVVGVATTAVGLSLAVRIREAYGTVEEDRLEFLDNQVEYVEATR